MKLKDNNLYYVGGVVRDEILGIPSFDVDYCYEGNAIKFAKNNGLNIIRENPDFGTVRVLFDGEEIDIASTRTESYPKKGHLPNVSNIGCSLYEDLKRRDFTMNAVAKRTTDGEIIDLFKGVNDIKNKTIRVLHSDSFIDDPTRILRALKFAVRFGFELDKETKNLQEQYLNNINYDMSYHRLRKELVETFNLNKQLAFDKFINDKIYMLLGNNQPESVKQYYFEDIINQSKINNCWIIYLFQFNLSNIELTRSEKRILEWSKRLLSEPVSNNTPVESVIISKLSKGDL